jgi:prepilin-type N-terminal cleavage/methylation domain-containing protein/prepilin-type processing-associated H-X9-DG protein
MTWKLHPDGSMRTRRNAFTLVEILVVVAILGAFASVIAVAAGHMRTAAKRTACLSNQRQIGIAMVSYASENNGQFPVSTHSTGPFRKDQSWIYQLAPYLNKVDEVRICPADSPKRQAQIRKIKATSYLMNDLVIDSPQYNRLTNIPSPGRTILLFSLSENRAPSTTRDHIHGSEWTSWNAALNDIEPDRHRPGARSSNRTKGSANYLYADGHVKNIKAQEFKSLFDRGINPAAVREN